jgi:hypothetical protein
MLKSPRRRDSARQRLIQEREREKGTVVSLRGEANPLRPR